MSEYLPSLRPTNTQFNLADFAYNDAYVTNKDIEYAINAVNNADSTQLTNITTLLSRTTQQSYAAGTTTYAGNVACTGLVCTSFTNGTTTNAELNYVNGVTSSIQTQLGTKANLSGGNTITGTQTFSNDIALNGSLLTITTPKILITAGTNKSCGASTLVNGVCTVSNTRVTSSSLIYLTRGIISASAALGNLQITTITDVTSFVITSLKDDTTTETNDQSTVNWLIVN